MREKLWSAIRANSRIWMGFLLIITDFLFLLAAGSLAVYIWSFVRWELHPPFYVRLIPLLFVFIVIYGYAKLYPAIGIGPVEELRRLTLSTTFVFLSLGTLSFWVRNAEFYSRASFILAWAFALLFVPLGREFMRRLFSRLNLWGEPVVIISSGPYGENILRFLLKNPKLGLCPVALIHGCDTAKSGPIEVPVLKCIELKGERKPSEILGVQTAIVVESEISKRFLRTLVEEYDKSFSNLILVSDAKQISSIWVSPQDIGGILGLRIRQNLLSRWQQFFKRLVDIGLILLASPVLIPALTFIALLIKLDSRGCIFYTQKRIGRRGEEIKIWKFRTMVPDADRVLEKYLLANPEYKAEWEATQKIKNDPRITKIGKILRRLSLDEFPQLWNVFKGEMSLVGPRPIVEEEVNNYGRCYKLYKQVRPGITGLWQVSGRNDVSYDRRVRLDEYYVRNWSIWMDLYILFNTIFVVLSAKGAY